ncbi:hypothetical protein ABHN11_21610 [Brevibacillus centrosporus]|uniref:hypothetical protein n=1 Tax=Brevibacillus centrosporus TaxID=54910 RepID=UPI003985F1CD
MTTALIQVIEEDILLLEVLRKDIRDHEYTTTKLELLRKNLQVIQSTAARNKYKVRIGRQELMQILHTAGDDTEEVLHKAKDLLGFSSEKAGELPGEYTDGGLYNTLNIDMDDMTERQRETFFSCLNSDVQKDVRNAMQAMCGFIENSEMDPESSLGHFESYLILVMIELTLTALHEEASSD